METFKKDSKRHEHLRVILKSSRAQVCKLKSSQGASKAEGHYSGLARLVGALEQDFPVPHHYFKKTKNKNIETITNKLIFY